MGGFTNSSAGSVNATISGTPTANYWDYYTVPCSDPSTVKSLATRVSVSHANRERQFIVGSFEGTLAVQRGEIHCSSGFFEPDWVEVSVTGYFLTRWVVVN